MPDKTEGDVSFKALLKLLKKSILFNGCCILHYDLKVGLIGELNQGH